MAALPARPRSVLGFLLIAMLSIATACGTGTNGLADRIGNGIGKVVPITAPKLTLAPAQPYAPLPGEPVPEVKQLAADVVQAIGNYAVGEGTVAGATSRLAARAAPTVAQAVTPLLVPTADSAVDIIYPQVSGVTRTEVGIMVVFRQRFLENQKERSVTRVADLRFQKTPTGWMVSEIASVGGDPRQGKPVSAMAEAVLGNDRIKLPEPARWDLQAGGIDERLLKVLLDLAREHTVDVAVFSGGHPRNVFGTKLVSNHTAGRAVDIWAVDGVPVISQRDKAGPLYSLVGSLLAQGVTELGSPWDFDGAAADASFTNIVHQDHLHLGFDR